MHSVASAPLPGPDIGEIAAQSHEMGDMISGMRPVHFAECGGRVATKVWRRTALPAGFNACGPAVIEEYGSTTIIGPHDHFSIGALGEIIIDCTGASS